MTKDEQRMGVEWSYLNTLLDLYKSMIYAYSKYLLSLEGLEHANHKKFFKCALSAFYCSVKASFDGWLENETEIKPKDYEKLPNDDEALKQMFFKINIWAQKKGPFATLVTKNDPYNAWKNG